MVAHQVGVMRVVGDEDDAQARITGLDDVLQHHPGLLDAEGGRRLVEDDDLGAEVDGTGDGDDLPLTAGEAAHRTVEVGDDDPHLRELLAADPFHLLDVQEQALADLVAQEEVPPHRHEWREREVLVDGGDAHQLRDAGAVEAAHDPVELHRALGVVVQAGDDLDERGLAGTVVTQHTGDLTLADADVHPPQRVHVAIALATVHQLEDGLVAALHLGLLESTHRPSAFRLTYMLTSTEAMSITPRKVLNQSTFQPAYVMPSWVMPKISAPIAAPTTEP